jgi:hypothetical protein
MKEIWWRSFLFIWMWIALYDHDDMGLIPIPYSGGVVYCTAQVGIDR